LARLRDGYSEFTARNAEILAIGPDSPEKFVRYWEENSLLFPGLPDPSKQVSRIYRQEVNLFKLGRMPLNAVVDRRGFIRYIHYGYSMSDIPDNETLLQVIDELNASSE
jgi:peroxiredoxin Q/BCP